MKCPNGDGELAPGKRHGVDVEACAACQGAWLTPQELNELEDKVFDLGDDEKGSLVLSAAPSLRACPQCAKPMSRFEYRAYDLELEFCADGHGFWLDDGEAEKVLALMREEESRLKRSRRAEDHWSAHLRHWRSHSFLDRIGGLFG